ncbi:biotin/lipoyl-binding carrier protein [Ferruginivarius sediminum]|uniref:Acetyl-CoA carboxylase biotin carboxyl carrier protein subunit n=1 Tax=Ferruginivarius sediminum TaxID=2661937 RepID=A0A369T9H5_9PROT|nr:biotin/lipoyl-binding carrier protein [Ferruginivarius sediminum]RDD61981.1 acetyl-CoA carboxylase biotin carboxyl carrier protein subunit [Ferruginivarius sediminum]
MSSVEVKSEVTGSVWKIGCRVGDTVTRDQELVILESMKMEIPVIAPQDGRIKELLVAEGDSIAEDQTIAVVEVG